MKTNFPHITGRMLPEKWLDKVYPQFFHILWKNITQVLFFGRSNDRIVRGGPAMRAISDYVPTFKLPCDC